MKALKIPVSGLMDAFGIEVDNLIKSGKVPGVEAQENDLIFDLEQMLPTPQIEGKVTKVRVEPNTIVYTIAERYEERGSREGDAEDARELHGVSGESDARSGNLRWKIATS